MTTWLKFIPWLIGACTLCVGVYSPAENSLPLAGIAPTERNYADKVNSSPCARIVSLAPSVTEVVAALGVENHLVGRTRFCRYPPSVRRVPEIGGFLDVNQELIFSLHPTEVISLTESQSVNESLRRLGIPVLVVNHMSVFGIQESIEQIGSRCGRVEEAHRLLNDLEERERQLRMRLTGKTPLRVLVSVGRVREGSSVSGVYISGRDGVYSDVLGMLGATNVNRQLTIALPTVSAEGIRALNPDAILEVINVDDTDAVETAAAFWRGYPDLPAVKNGRVVVLSEDFASIPGPRYIELAETLGQRLYPDAFDVATPSSH